MVIVAKIGSEEMYTPHVTVETGLFKKKRVQTQDFESLDEVINQIQEKYGDRYTGLFDLFEFQINGEAYPYWSKCTYEEIFSWSQLGKDGITHAFDKKDEGTWEWRKHLRTASLNAAYYRNPEGSEYEYSIGQEDSEIDAKISYDMVLYGLENAKRFLEANDHKNFLKTFDNAKKALDIAKKTHDIPDWNDFDPVLEYFDSIDK